MAKLLFDHYIVLILENRSFDHVFGYLGKGDGVPAGAVNYKSAGNARSPAFPARRGADFTAIGQGPSHSLKETNVQLFGSSKPKAGDQATLDGFIDLRDRPPRMKRGRGPSSPSFLNWERQAE